MGGESEGEEMDYSSDEDVPDLEPDLNEEELALAKDMMQYVFVCVAHGLSIMLLASVQEVRWTDQRGR